MTMLKPKVESLLTDAEVLRIINLCKANGYNISPVDVQHVWGAWSRRCYAITMSLPDDDTELLGIVLEYTEEAH